MSKPSWITIENGTGTGNGSFIIKAARYYGRLGRTGTVTVSGQGVTDKKITVSQAGAEEFVEFTSKSQVITKNGGTAIFYGRSNAPYLNFKFVGYVAGDSQGTTCNMVFISDDETIRKSTSYNGKYTSVVRLPDYFQFDGTGSAAPTGNTTQLGSSTGCYDEYDFRIEITVPANATELPQEITLQATGSVNTAFDQAKITLNEGDALSLEVYKDAAYTTVLDSLTFSAEGESKTAYVKSNTSWSVS